MLLVLQVLCCAQLAGFTQHRSKPEACAVFIVQVLSCSQLPFSAGVRAA
jgi:hypothetical protein